MGPVPPPGVAETGHPTGGGPDGGVPWGRRTPAICLSLSLPSSLFSPSKPVPLPRSRGNLPPRAPPHERGGPRTEPLAAPRAPPRGAGPTGISTPAAPVSPLPPRQFLDPLPATGAAGRPGPVFWRCGDPGYFIGRCPVMDAPQAAPDQAGLYQIPVSIKGGTYQALVDSGCNQTSIHQSLIQPEALDKSRMVRVRCVHGDVVNHPLVSVAIQFRGQKHRVEVAFDQVHFIDGQPLQPTHPLSYPYFAILKDRLY